MSNVINLKKAKQRRAEGKTLCTSGFHKWQLLAGRRFDVKQGRLVSTERCQRCGEERIKLT
ncbi:hypothetical protein [Steroidobacter sp.]|uniref:hypothetical protein n=1 Tax=Steroidobacter sp. TaxID=1978227 RepID=UPI001A61EBFC|nr:hypothetical protein [Steroidobacter sp.]MBL8265869.1 hypothetical protein [Steroidobacter sp.]